MTRASQVTHADGFRSYEDAKQAAGSVHRGASRVSFQAVASASRR
jgi:hypothetical protein